MGTGVYRRAWTHFPRRKIFPLRVSVLGTQLVASPYRAYAFNLSSKSVYQDPWRYAYRNILSRRGYTAARPLLVETPTLRHLPPPQLGLLPLRDDQLLPWAQSFRRATNEYLEQIRRITNAGIVLENLNGKIITVSDTGPANSDFIVRHNLGRVVQFYNWEIDREGVVYDSKRSLWNTEIIFAKCSVANASVVFYVI